MPLSGCEAQYKTSMADFFDLFKMIPDIDAALAASVFHFGEIEIKELKRQLNAEGITMRI